MKLKPFPHQKRFAKGYAGSRLLVHEGGTGKTVCGSLWMKDGRDADALVLCPPRVVRKWKKALEEWGTKATVMTDTEFKKAPVREWSCVVIDEADEYASPLFVAKSRSARAEALYALVQAYPDMETLLLTATPIRSNPWNLHTLLCYIGEYVDWKQWRKEFFYLQMPDKYRFKFLERPAYLPVPDWREKAKEKLEQHADIVLLRDCVKSLPPVLEETVDVKTPEFIQDEESTPFYSEHRWEQQNKLSEILRIAKGFRKVLVVAFYTEQIESLKKALSKERETFAIYGKVSTKDQEPIIEAAQASDECFLIVQASSGAGFDGDTFSCVIFASMSYSVRDFVQMKFRVRRIHNLHPVKLHFLHGGRCDEAVHDHVEKGKTFVPSEWYNKNTPS